MADPNVGTTSAVAQVAHSPVPGQSTPFTPGPLDVDNHPDARLMAAAPDLYRALSDLVNELPDVAIDVFREVAGNSNASALRARRSAAIKALARARGEVAQ